MQQPPAIPPSKGKRRAPTITISSDSDSTPLPVLKNIARTTKKTHPRINNSPPRKLRKSSNRSVSDDRSDVITPGSSRPKPRMKQRIPTTGLSKSMSELSVESGNGEPSTTSNPVEESLVLDLTTTDDPHEPEAGPSTEPASVSSDEIYGDDPWREGRSYSYYGF